MAIVAETFPKIIGCGAVNLCVIIDENGLIRGIGAMEDRIADLKLFFTNVFTVLYRPLYFLSDFDTTYPSVIKGIISNIIIFKDTVHAKRSIFRSARSTIKNMNVKTNGKITKKKQKQINKLKQKLMRKLLYPILIKMCKGFKPKNVSICSYYFLGGLQELKELAERFPSLMDFYKKTEKFMSKYIEIFAEIKWK